MFVPDTGFAIEGPSQAEIKCKDNGDGSCEVSYFPTVEGEYAIHVTYEEEDIPNSPFIAKVTPNLGGFDATKVCNVFHLLFHLFFFCTEQYYIKRIFGMLN